MRRFDAVAIPAVSGIEGLPRSGFTTGDVEVVFPELEASDVSAVVGVLIEAGRVLAARPVSDVVASLGAAGIRFSTEGDPFREEALSLLPATSGLSPEMCVAVLNGMARDWTTDRIARMLEVELGDPAALDGFVTLGDRRAMACGPRLSTQIVAGSVPGVGVQALVRSLAVKSPTLLKPGRGDVVLPVLFARALREVDPALADALAVSYWPGGSDALEVAAVADAEVAVVYGSDAAVAAVRSRLPETTRFVAYHHRVSVGAVGVEALVDGEIVRTTNEVAHAIALFDQRGCVSPHVLYVEEGGAATLADFGRRLATVLDEVEVHLPAGELSVEEAAAVQQVRGTAELVAASGSGDVHHGGEKAAWTVVIGGDESRLAHACGGRAVHVHALERLEELPGHLEPIGRHLQTVGIAGAGARLEALAAECGRVGVTRVVPFSRMAFPDPWWYHDGRGPLTELVRWVEL